LIAAQVRANLGKWEGTNYSPHSNYYINLTTIATDPIIIAVVHRMSHCRLLFNHFENRKQAIVAHIVSVLSASGRVGNPTATLS